jgi:hypothetical protein
LIGSFVIGLAVALGVPASSQGPTVPGPEKPAGTGSRGISVAVPTGKVFASPEVRGEPVFVRRTTGTGGVTIVEISTTPFAPFAPLASVARPDEASVTVEQVVGRPDTQPASW